MSGNRSASRHGAIGGVLAATSIVLFFFILDVAQGAALETPRLMASMLLGGEAEAIGTGALILYTALHFLVFIAVGVGAALLLKQLRAPATFLLGFVVGFLLFDVMFYGSLAFSGVEVVEAIGWPLLLAGNLVGGVVLMAYLSRAGIAPGRTWGEALAEHRVLREGVIAGVIGGLAVAAWFFVVDLFLGRVLYTPGALGSALLNGVTSADAIEVTASTVLGYSAIHFTGFIVMGIVFAALVTRAEENPPLLMGLVLLFVTFETFLLGLVAILAAWLLEVLTWWSIALSNLVAAAAMAAYLWNRHPRLQGTVSRSDDDSLEAEAGRRPVTGG